MPVLWVPFNPDTGLIKPDSSGNDVGYVVGYISELGKADDFPDAEIVNDIIIPNFIPKFESEEIKNYDYDAIIKTTTTNTYTYYNAEQAYQLNLPEFGWTATGGNTTQNKDIKADIRIDNKDKITGEINSWLTNKYKTILKLIPGFYIVTERTLINDISSNFIPGGQPTSIGKGGESFTSANLQTTKSKQKELIKGLRKLPRQLIKCKVKD